jgi:hypothetical protein
LDDLGNHRKVVIRVDLICYSLILTVIVLALAPLWGKPIQIETIVALLGFVTTMLSGLVIGRKVQNSRGKNG